MLAQRLRAGGLVCLVSDRDLTESGVEVDFFGEKARMPPVRRARGAHRRGADAGGDAGSTARTGAPRIYDEIPVPADGHREARRSRP